MDIVGRVIGPPIGVGRSAEVYALDHRRVVKLLLPGFDATDLITEARKTQAVHDAGVAAPATHGEHSVDGRFGYAFDRAVGEVMLRALHRQPWRYRRYADLLASIHTGVHGRTSADLPSVKERLVEKIDKAADLGPSLRSAAKDRLLTLEDGDRVLHGDFHPGNVILCHGGPVIIDWLDASRGSPAADVARSLWLLSGATIPSRTPWRRVLVAYIAVFRRRYFRRYRALAGMSHVDIGRWRLPVLAGRLSEGIEHEIAPLLAEIRRHLG